MSDLKIMHVFSVYTDLFQSRQKEKGVVEYKATHF